MEGTVTQTIGDRIAARRRLTGKSVRQLAAEAGISHTTWGRIERGERGADNRIILHNIARVLRCSVTDLTGQPAVPGTPSEAKLEASIHDLLAALVDADLDDEPSTAARPWGELQREGDLLDDLYRRADHLGTAARLAVHTREVHAGTVTATRTDDRATGLRMTIIGASRNSRLLRATGHRAEAYLAGERAEQAARELGDPVLLANAYRTRSSDAMGCGSHTRALRLTARGLETLAGQMDLPGAQETAGHLHLRSAMACYALGRSSDGDVHLDAAMALAEATGDTDTFGLYFGPTNVGFWRLAIVVDSGDPADAVQIARETNPAKMGSADRQGAFYIDAARALALMETRDADKAAVRMLLTAERVAPQRLAKTPFAAEALRMILRRARRSDVDPILRGLVERLNVTA